MGLDLLFHQMALGNLKLLVLSVAFKTDDFHPVQQRLRQVHAVCGCHEHYVRQIEIDFQIMVIELVVLFRIENLKQGRRRIAPEILSKLVNFIEQEQRVHRPCLFQIGRDLAGH